MSTEKSMYEYTPLEKPVRLDMQSWPDGTRPLVSICCITYNHEKFIEECLDGFLMQETTFPVEILIHDDASTDETANIIRRYERISPKLIKPIYQKENHWQKKMRGNLHFNFPRAQGKYIALCEGDDCWIRSFKLEKQTNFLENNSEYALVSHSVLEIDYINKKNSIFPDIVSDVVIPIEEFIKDNPIGTCSILFKNGALKNASDLLNAAPFGDLAISLTALYTSNRKAKVIGELMGVYRVHVGGIHGSLRVDDSKLIQAYEMQLNFFEVIKAKLFSNGEYADELLNKEITTNKRITNLIDFGKKLTFIGRISKKVKRVVRDFFHDN